MYLFRKLVGAALIICCVTVQAKSTSVSTLSFRTFWHPTYLGERLDYCTLDKAHCGKDVADAYCHMLGYEYASQQEQAYNVGRTHFFASRAQCTGWRCNGFMSISCANHIAHTPAKPYYYREKKFADPRYNNYRVDWCYDKDKGCGAKAARSFCRRLGFMKAKKFSRETMVYATQAIGSQELCFGSQCQAFKEIICYR